MMTKGAEDPMKRLHPHRKIARECSEIINKGHQLPQAHWCHPLCRDPGCPLARRNEARRTPRRRLRRSAYGRATCPASGSESQASASECGASSGREAFLREPKIKRTEIETETETGWTPLRRR